ncbi:MAG: hypothetical protein J6S85_12460 [Methanobrevibacter sp.]|nr:hypothetical protein [Methanobrevibacter sp.]
MTFKKLKKIYSSHPDFEATEKDYKFKMRGFVFYDNHEIDLNGRLFAFDVSFDDMDKLIKKHWELDK